MRLPRPFFTDPSLPEKFSKQAGFQFDPASPPLISEATIDDALKILGLQHHSYLSEAERTKNYTIPPLTETLEDIHCEFERQTFFKAVAGSRLIGAARAMVEGDTCYVSRVIIHPDLQGCGLGRQLMAQVEAQFPDVARFELFTGEKSDRNLNFYAKLGYREFKRVFRESDQTMLVYMEKVQ